MAENNEEQYLDELLNSLRSSNTGEETDGEQDSEKAAADNDIVLDDGTEVIDNADKDNGLYDDIGPIIDESQPDDVGPIIDEPQPDDIPPVVDEQHQDVVSSNDESMTEGLPEDNSSDSNSSDDIFALEDNFDIGEEPEKAAYEQKTDIEEKAEKSDDADEESEKSDDDSDDDSDDGLMQLLNQINGEDGKHEEKPDNAAGADKNNSVAASDNSKSVKEAKEEEKERKKAEKLAKKEQRKKEKEEKKNAKKDKKTSAQPEESSDAEESVNSASQENIDLINELYSDTDSLDNAPLGDDLADIPERDAEEEEPKKPKKEKKKKEPKPKKPKKEKVKKEKKAPKPSELVKVTPKTFLGIIIFAVVITVVVIFGTKIVNYSVSVKHAIDHFNNGKYDQAYDSIAGLEVKDKDKDTYYKIRTVASVYVDYTSYVNYRQLGMNVEALDSLIKGLGHYDDYYADAEKYDVVAQYDGVKDIIIDELARYGVSEEDARYYAGLESERQYEEILNNIGGRMQ